MVEARMVFRLRRTTHPDMNSAYSLLDKVISPFFSIMANLEMSHISDEPISSTECAPPIVRQYVSPAQFSVSNAMGSQVLCFELTRKTVRTRAQVAGLNGTTLYHVLAGVYNGWDYKISGASVWSCFYWAAMTVKSPSAELISSACNFRYVLNDNADASVKCLNTVPYVPVAPVNDRLMRLTLPCWRALVRSDDVSTEHQTAIENVLRAHDDPVLMFADSSGAPTPQINGTGTG